MTNMEQLKDFLNKEIRKDINTLTKSFLDRKSISLQKLYSLKELLELALFFEKYSSSDDLDFKRGAYHEKEDKHHKLKDSHYKDDDYKSDDYSKWLDKLINVDGSKGPHWSLDKTNDIAKEHNVYFEDISDKDWNMTLNMVYSDYSNIAKKYGIDTASFYVDIAKAWLFDDDTISGKDKLKEYYKHIVSPKTKY